MIENKQNILKNCLDKILDIKNDLHSINKESFSSSGAFGIQGLDDGSGDVKVDKSIEILQSYLSVEYIKTLKEFENKFKSKESLLTEDILND